MSNSASVDYTAISPNKTSPRNNSIKKITIHHMAGNLSLPTCGNIFSKSSAQASANYAIDSNGTVGLYVDENDRAWTSSSPSNDHQAITIEVANDGGADTNWHVSDIALAALIDLCVDICQRNGINGLNYTGDSTGNLTRHNMFAATTCPGPYLESKFLYIADEVNKRLGVETTTTTDTTPAATNMESTSCLGVIAQFQTWLNCNYSAGLSVDNLFGPKTKTAAIKAMQTIIGVTADGIWGPKSKAACPVLVKGNSGAAVYVLQGLLYCRVYVYSGFDGVFGQNTENEVKSYQGANGLTVDGKAGKDTFTKLVA